MNKTAEPDIAKLCPWLSIPDYGTPIYGDADWPDTDLPHSCQDTLGCATLILGDKAKTIDLKAQSDNEMYDELMERDQGGDSGRGAG